MTTPANEVEPDDSGSEGPTSPKEVVRRSLITGTAIILPLGVTLLVLGFVANSISGQLDPVTNAIQNSQFVAQDTEELLIELVTLAALVTVILVLGFLAEFTERGTKLGQQFDELMAALPGIGSVYTSFDEMSDIMLDSDTDSFQDVKLVEYPGDDSYTVAFKTAETPSVIERGVGQEDMVTLFMPMAPNPVMGGFVIHVSRDRVVDIDLTVEQGIRSIVTSGVAIGGEDVPEHRGLTEAEMKRLAGDEQPVRRTTTAGRGDDSTEERRRAEYDDAVAPEHSETPGMIAERERDGDRDATGSVPAEEAGREPERRDETDETPASAADRDAVTHEPTDGTPAEQAKHDGE
jgi:uncharacterized membrane protein